MTPRIVLTALASALACAGCITPTGSNGNVQVTGMDYPGGTKSYVLRNAFVEATVVPSLGRVMRFNFIGGDSVLWENPVLVGKPMPPTPWSTPGSYGGDKTWPAPQSSWNWPPPAAFDSQPAEARVDGNAVVLTTPVDPRTGIRAERRVMLNPFEPVMRIVTTYEKVQGDPVEVSVWVISQFRDPVGAYFRVPPNSRFPQGYNTEWGIPTNHVTVQGGIVKLTRDTASPHKIGSDAPALLWVGREQMCLIEVGRTPGARYPDSGSSVEIYTNPNPADYVEMETLGPLQTLRVGERLTAVNSYTLKRRNRTDPDADVRPVLPH